MSFKVDAREVSELAEKMKAASNVLESDLHMVTQQLDELIALESFSGAAATNAKNYFDTFHKTAIGSFQLIAHQLSANIHTHIDTFKADVDSHVSARIDYHYLQEVKKNVKTVHSELEESVGNIATTLEDISDIVAIDPPRMIELETEKNNMVKSIDVLTSNVERFIEKGADHDDEMKEMLHHLETMINEASSSTGKERFTTIESAKITNSLAFLGEATQLLGERQKEQWSGKVSNMLSEGMEIVATIERSSVKYERSPNFFVSSAEFLFDVAKGGSRAMYTISEEVVRGVFELMTDPVGTLEVLATMVSQPVDTGYQIGKMIAGSYNRDVIHGDAESRAYWFVYAFGNVFGLKGLGNLGKSGATAAKTGAQKTGKKLDELLPYHPKHQVALVGPVPYNVFNGGFFVDRLVMMAERTPGRLGGMSAGGRKVGKGTGNKIDSDTIKKYIRDIEGRTGRELPKNQIGKLKEALRNKEYKKMSPIETAKHRAEFDKVKNKVIKEWEENTGQKWPVYNENVISEKTGKIIRKQGDKYDAHHIIENTFGGEHEWWNMHPAKFPNEHQAGIHGAGSQANTLFKGGKK